MPFRLYQSNLAITGRASFAAGRKRGDPTQMRAFACIPLLANAPMGVDGTMMSGIAALVLFAGISVGLLYRHMQEREERLSRRAAAAESELRALLTMTDDAVFVISSDGIIREVNPGAEELFMSDAAILVGRTVSSMVPHHLPLAELTRNGPAAFQSESPRSDGGRVPLDVLLSQVALGEVTSYLAIVRPAVAVAADALAKPVRQACHDLNNHFTTLLGNLSLVLMSGSADSATHERVLGAKKAGLRAQQTVRKLHQLAAGDDAGADADPPPGTIVQMPLPTPVTPPPANSDQRPRVLVLDDEEAICLLVASALDSSGFDVTTAADGATAVKTCEEAVMAGRPFGVVVSDLSLPGQLDGRAAVARMRALDPSLQAIVSSGHDSDPIMHRYREHGFAAALAKPFEMATLIRLVGELMPGALRPRRSA
jgi:PAS domain S-box-containing protein